MVEATLHALDEELPPGQVMYAKTSPAARALRRVLADTINASGVELPEATAAIIGVVVALCEVTRPAGIDPFIAALRKLAPGLATAWEGRPH